MTKIQVGDWYVTNGGYIDCVNKALPSGWFLSKAGYLLDPNGLESLDAKSIHSLNHLIEPPVPVKTRVKKWQWIFKRKPLGTKEPSFSVR